MNKPEICVYCGASSNAVSRHLEGAYNFGLHLAKADFDLVYGGGQRGLMGQVAQGVLDGQGKVTGIIPEFLTELERVNLNATELRVVNDMHTRKISMFNLADAFVVLPGGLGTLEEMFEVITWKQLRQHDKPVLIVNKDGYWQLLADMIEKMRTLNYLHNDRDDLMVWLESEEQALDWLVNWHKAGTKNTELAKENPG